MNQGASMSTSHIANAFEDGVALKSGPVDVVMTPREMGQLYLPSGRVVACDPIHLYDLKPFAQSISAGRYPVILSIAEARHTNAQRVAFAMLRVSDETPVHWELATKVTKYLSRNNIPTLNELHDFKNCIILTS
jgi:hypothetical protein